MNKEFLKELYLERMEDEPYIKAYFEIPKMVESGAAASSWMYHLEFLAIARYYVDGDVNGFKDAIKDVGMLMIKTLKDFNNGIAISPSYVSMLVYKKLFLTLAGGNFSLAHEIARLMGGRLKIEKEFDHPFDYCLGYLLKYLVLNDEEKALEYIDKFEAICQKRGNKSYSYFIPVFRGILNKDEKMLNEGLSNLEKGCSRLRRSNEASPFKYLNTWGIGLANLAIHRGMKVEVDDEYMPKDLLIGG